MRTYRITCIDKWQHRLILRIAANSNLDAMFLARSDESVVSVLDVEAQ